MIAIKAFSGEYLLLEAAKSTRSCNGAHCNDSFASGPPEHFASPLHADVILGSAEYRRLGPRKCVILQGNAPRKLRVVLGLGHFGA